MGIKSPRSIDMYRQVTGEYDRSVHGARTATLYCDLDHKWGTVGEVRGGRAVFGNYGPYDLLDSNEDVYAHCQVCPPGKRTYVIEMAKLRSKLKGPQRGKPKINILEVARREGRSATSTGVSSRRTAT